MPSNIQGLPDSAPRLSICHMDNKPSFIIGNFLVPIFSLVRHATATRQTGGIRTLKRDFEGVHLL